MSQSQTKPESVKVLSSIGQVTSAGTMARKLLMLAREGNLIELLDNLDNLRFSGELFKVQEAVDAGALEHFFTVQGVEGSFAVLRDGIHAWNQAGQPNPGVTQMFFHTWDGKAWPGVSMGPLGKKPTDAFAQTAAAS